MAATLGRKLSEDHKRKISIKLKGKKKKPFSSEHKKNISEAKKLEYKNGRVSPLKKIWEENPNFLRGENNYKWVKDRTKIKGRHERKNDPCYKQWVKAVKKRDNHCCKINNHECTDKIQAHHILSWREYPELRYKTNNGITLCHAHHPRGGAEEKRLIPLFKGLMTVSNRNI